MNRNSSKFSVSRQVAEVRGKYILLFALYQTLVIFLSSCAAQTSGHNIAVGIQNQLLVDDHIIAEKTKLTRVLSSPEKRGIVMQASTPTDFTPDGLGFDTLSESSYKDFGYRTTVIWNTQDQKFQMLYRASSEHLTAYAESEDGLTWRKPFISDDKKSNLISYNGKTSKTFYEVAFMVDPTVPWGHPEKFKAAFNPGNAKCAIAHSADGIHWVGYNNGASVTGRAADTHNQILWDPVASRYLLLTRTDIGAQGGRKEIRSTRIMQHENKNNLRDYPESWKTLTTIKIDDPEGNLTSAGVPELQMEAMNIWIHENIYFALMHVLKTGEFTGAKKDQVSATDRNKPANGDVVDFYIGTSRDGINFDMSWVYARKPFMARGDDNSFDKGMVHATSEIINRGDEHWIYYTGIFNRHHAPREKGSQAGKIGLAVLPLNRFIGQEAGNEEGSLITKPFHLEGDQLEMNIDASAGTFYAEILDENGHPIQGFSKEDAIIQKNTDGLRVVAAWKGKNDFSMLKNKVIRLRFCMRNAILYSFQIKP